MRKCTALELPELQSKIKECSLCHQSCQQAPKGNSQLHTTKEAMRLQRIDMAGSEL